MKFVFVLCTLDKDCGADLYIPMAISRALIKKGHKVFALVRNDADHRIHDKFRDSFSGIYEVYEKHYELMKSMQGEVEWGELSSVQKICMYIKHPESIRGFVDGYFFNGLINLKREYIEKIEFVDRELKPDVFVAFMLPHWTEEVLCKADIKAKKGLFQLDTYVKFEFIGERETERRKRKEQKNVDKADGVFVTDLILRDMKQVNMRIDEKKFVVYQFPGIRLNEKKRPDISCGETINIYFIGSLYNTIRNPEFVLRLFQQLPDRYVLHIAGNGAEDVLNKYTDLLGKRLVLHGRVYIDEAYKMMESAEILLNIGNTVYNQIPSKIFDYINTGRPIINVCKSKKCPSINYISKYPLGINIYEEDGITDKMIEDIKKFVESNNAKSIDQRELLKIYPECTDDYVSKQLVDYFG